MMFIVILLCEGVTTVVMLVMGVVCLFACLFVYLWVSE